MEVYHAIPFLNALIYTVGALCIKRATTHGVGPWRTTFITNLAIFLVAFPLWFLGKPLGDFSQLFVLFGVGATFFLGQILVCLAIHKGDVSLLTPLLGTKTVFVAIIVSVGMGEVLSSAVWLGAVLSAVAILLMRGGGGVDGKRALLTIYLGIGCSVSYAGTDALTQAYGAEIGFHKMAAGTFSSVMLLSFLLIPFFRSSIQGISGRTWGWMAAGAVLMATQAALMAFVLSTYGRATVVNVIYSSRGIWSVVLVWCVGHWFLNEEQSLGRGILIRRLIGSLLLVGAIVAVMR